MHFRLLCWSLVTYSENHYIVQRSITLKMIVLAKGQILSRILYWSNVIILVKNIMLAKGHM